MNLVPGGGLYCDGGSLSDSSSEVASGERSSSDTGVRDDPDEAGERMALAGWPSWSSLDA